MSGALGYANEGTGSGRFVRGTLTATSLAFSRSAGICVFLGPNGTTGELSGAVDLYGFG